MTLAGSELVGQRPSTVFSGHIITEGYEHSSCLGSLDGVAAPVSVPNS